MAGTSIISSITISVARMSALYTGLSYPQLLSTFIASGITTYTTYDIPQCEYAHRGGQSSGQQLVFMWGPFAYHSFGGQLQVVSIQKRWHSQSPKRGGRFSPECSARPTRARVKMERARMIKSKRPSWGFPVPCWSRACSRSCWKVGFRLRSGFGVGWVCFFAQSQTFFVSEADEFDNWFFCLPAGLVLPLPLF
ncbi:hypothetical protein FGO68_gene3007 [Halteria grandinella]|uniref:Uncharacterized protein n=1 Tax=Halteria grandinella TaxID=5974 RepID=A0A8J8NGI3_HALGN|nr:hypothetical protein FGO68_gene3007 [Halteria grandinella]